MSDTITGDFIFGTLATDDLRLAAIRAESRALSHGYRTVPADPEPDEAVDIFVSAGTEMAARSVAIVYTLDGSIPDLKSARVECQPEESVWDTLLWGYRRQWRGTIPAQPEGTYIRYAIVATTEIGATVWSAQESTSNVAAMYSYHVDKERVPDWLRDAVIYQVFLDRFSPGAGSRWIEATQLNDVWGGTIRGVTEALPYLVDLGITCLWLSPLFPSPTHHGYDATDYFTVEPRLGTLNDLQNLFTSAHASGMRVILDFVANHLSDQHPLFKRALHDPKARERSWFTFPKQSENESAYESFFGVMSMPKLNTDDPGARAHLITAACYWLDQGADGFRLDYANGPSHDFWTAFRAATRSIKPDAVTLGEVVETAELQRTYQGRLDGTLDFLLLQQMRAFFAFRSLDASAFVSFLNRHFDFFPADYALPSFLDNHDMNRFLWVTNGDKRCLKLAAFCQFTLPHPPIVYYGTEVGLTQLRDLTYPDGSRRLEESRTLMPWDDEQDRELHAFYRQLIALRRQGGALWRGKRTVTDLTDDAFAIRLETGDTSGLMVVNRSHSPFDVAIPTGFELAFASDAGTETIEANGHVPPMTGALWTSYTL